MADVKDLWLGRPAHPPVPDIHGIFFTATRDEISELGLCVGGIALSQASLTAVVRSWPRVD